MATGLALPNLSISSGLALPGNLARKVSQPHIPPSGSGSGPIAINGSSSHTVNGNTSANGIIVEGPEAGPSGSNHGSGSRAREKEDADADGEEAEADEDGSLEQELLGGVGSVGGKSKKRKSISAAAGAGAGNGNGSVLGTTGAAGSITTANLGQDTVGGVTAVGKEYRYSAEISQMMFVFGEVQDPLVETVRLVEDIVRGQIVEIITRARHLSLLRSSRYVSADDVIFLIRDDRGKVNRLRTYLSWKDVRKKAKDDESGEAGAEVDMDDAEKMTAKIRNTMVKLPWELLTPFSDTLKNLPSSQNREDDEEQDEDEMQAYQDSMQRLRDADEITKKMTKDEYVHYSDCRQASFTYRKGKRFREFINFSAYLDTGPNDDIVDILGFLSFEMVRTLCVKSLDVRDRMEKSVTAAPTSNHSGGTGKNKRSDTRGATIGTGSGAGASAGRTAVGTIASESNASPQKRKSLPVGNGNGNGGMSGDLEDVKKTGSPERISGAASGSGGSVSPEQPVSALPSTGAGSMPPPKRQKMSSNHNHDHTKANSSSAEPPMSLFAPPPSARQPLLPAHVLEAFALIQREQGGSRVGGMRNFRGGVMRGKLALV